MRFSRGWFLLRSGHGCAHLLRRPWGIRARMGGSEAWLGGLVRELEQVRCPASDSHRAFPAFLLPHSSDATLSSEWKMGQVLAREGLPELQTGRRWVLAWSTGLRFQACSSWAHRRLVPSLPLARWSGQVAQPGDRVGGRQGLVSKASGPCCFPSRCDQCLSSQ